ncbi:hypothetical protein Salat_1835500 [Sesamum alatum]|uniref:Uncharacterized protein n=1 Tax=Sesamum alatum TaxID=300844 RepID=A0AAE1Y2F9_9LAMI|nr:hypothetical protein Salat_1835500 [Sesamum alatum]
MWRHEKALVDVKIRDLQKNLTDSEQSEKEFQDSKVTFEAKIDNLEAQLQRSAVEVERASTVALDREKAKDFSEGCAAGITKGLIEGRDVYLQSDEHKKIKATQFTNEGFERCRSHVMKLKGFVEGFDQSSLDPTLDANLEPYPEEDTHAAIEQDAFEALIEEVKILT